MINHEWESIDESLFEEAKVGECVQVTCEKPYMAEMEAQNTKVLTYLQEKYPERQFRLSRWFPHDFGDYQEVEECIPYENLCSGCGVTLNLEEEIEDGMCVQCSNE